MSLALLAACQPDPKRPEELRGVRLPDPVTKIDFTLTATDGTLFSFLTETEGYVTLLFFGYTNCPDVCPIHMANLAAVLAKLSPAVANQVKVVMVTTDPARDDQQHLRSWLDGFDRSFIGLVGPLEVVNETQQRLGLPPATHVPASGDYTVGHASQIMAFTKDNRAHVVYPFGTRQSDWAHDLPLLVNATSTP